LHIKKAVIAGESMGGYIALAFLQKYPESVSKLILSDTQAIADTPEAKEKREATARDVLKNGTQSFINGFMTKALSPTAPADTHNYLRTIVNVQSANAIASALRGMALRNDTTAVLEETNVPILIITGEDDTLISPLQSKNMHALAKNSKLVIIKHAGHLSSLEQPAQWNEAVVNWVE
jgi:pimeloyl-ACP methyl ester carboxylesterase